MFNYAIKRRHMPPYADNPFSVIEIDSIPVEDAKPFIDLPPEKERRLLELCDDWQFPIFATLMLTGLRPGELTHLLLPDDLDLREGWLYVRNKPALGWQVKTRSERRIPLLPEHVAILRRLVGDRRHRPVFVRRRCTKALPKLSMCSIAALEDELTSRVATATANVPGVPGVPEADLPGLPGAGVGVSKRQHQRRQARYLWRDMGAIKPDKLREEFMQLTTRIGLPELTAPKTLRHLFATALQDANVDANVDPLVRNQLMGHSSAGRPTAELGMTSVYTHTRTETLRNQLAGALASRPCVEIMRSKTRTVAAA